MLRLAGFSVETVSCPQEVRDRLEQKHYELLLLCHSLGEADIDSLTETAARAGVLTYRITALTPAEVLIHDTEALVRSSTEQG